MALNTVQEKVVAPCKTRPANVVEGNLISEKNLHSFAAAPLSLLKSTSAPGAGDILHRGDFQDKILLISQSFCVTKTMANNLMIGVRGSLAGKRTHLVCSCIGPTQINFF
jgi:hypothetical protein